MRPSTPTIEIHLAHDDDISEIEIQPLRSPYSPKFPSPMAYSDSDADDFRPVHLLPPPTLSPVARPLKLTPAPLPTDKKGIDQERFAELLKTSRERASMKHGRKESLELRKQVTLKAHTTKALERRALFLSKIQSPPSPTQTDSPVTPPDSPAVFHFTLPSPGMLSPLAVFGSLPKSPTSDSTPNSNCVQFPRDSAPSSEASRRPAKGWVEEVDFKARVRSNGLSRNGSSPASLSPELDLAVTQRSQARHARSTSGHGLPSLDQITARLAKAGNIANPPSDAVAPSLSAVGVKKGPELSLGKPRLSLPTHRRSPSPPVVASPVEPAHPKVEPTPAPIAAPTAAPAVSRLPSFLQKQRVAPPRESTPATPSVVVEVPAPVDVKPSLLTVVLSSPPQNRPRPSNPPPPRLPPSQPFTARAMPDRLPIYQDATTPETRKQRGQDMVEKLKRRSSAPAALPPNPNRRGQHRVLSMKGGF